MLRNLVSTKEQSAVAHHMSAADSSVYDKLRMFNGQAAAASWAWYGAAAASNPAAAVAASSPHLHGLTTSGHHGGGGGGGGGGAGGSPAGGVSSPHSQYGSGTPNPSGNSAIDPRDTSSADDKKALSGRTDHHYFPYKYYYSV